LGVHQLETGWGIEKFHLVSALKGHDNLADNSAHERLWLIGDWFKSALDLCGGG